MCGVKTRLGCRHRSGVSRVTKHIPRGEGLGHFAFPASSVWHELSSVCLLDNTSFGWSMFYSHTTRESGGWERWVRAQSLDIHLRWRFTFL